MSFFRFSKFFKFFYVFLGFLLVVRAPEAIKFPGEFQIPVRGQEHEP